MLFPIALEAYEETKQGDILIERRVVVNEIELASFQLKHMRKLIVTQPLTADELGDERLKHIS